MGETTIEISAYGTKEAIDSLDLRQAAIRKAVVRTMRLTGMGIAARAKTSMGEPGKPARRKGDLSRSIISKTFEEGDVITGIIGSTFPFKTSYAAILELGGPIPEIRPKKGKYLKFVRATGWAGNAHQAVLESGGTYDKAKKAALRAHRRLGTSPFVFVKSVPARYQRAMPYLRPALDEDTPRIKLRFEKAIAAAKKGMKSGPGES